MPQCTICCSLFLSKNALFRHLRSAHLEDLADSVKSAQPSTEHKCNPRQNWQNEDFEVFYQHQTSLHSNKEWEVALQSFKQPLPLVFRVNLHSSPAGAIWKQSLQGVQQVCPVPFSNDIFVADGTPAFLKTLAAAQDQGVVQRQEAVSCLPVLALDVLPHHRVLDMCCAPGSKTLQILDHMHNGTQFPSGILVANDSNRARAMTVAYRSRRASRTPFLLLASDARFFPTLKKKRGYKLEFDRVLCDVPCSGDGTLRKVNWKTWQSWGVKLGLSLHAVQLKILTRGLRLLKAGGKAVYSTCSLNPVSVVAT
mmetsp:Transcript_28779/g.56527  ORF Transcript_28779/g.56527 Transcript_28779/m.56527 type:complete len:310 (-) Transcript_28779:1228-2157(-)